jgi:hypothetical protein
VGVAETTVDVGEGDAGGVSRFTLQADDFMSLLCSNRILRHF